jgi:hypothetical protein
MASPSDQIRSHLQTAILLLERYAKRPGPLDMLDVLAVLGMVEHEIDMAREVAHRALRQP